MMRPRRSSAVTDEMTAAPAVVKRLQRNGFPK
jgi:hypothetical protein